MWEHPVTARHLRQINADAGGVEIPSGLDLAEIIAHVNRTHPRLRIAPTQIKELACRDWGDGAMAEPEDIASLITSFRLDLAPSMQPGGTEADAVG
jgi:phosphopantothenoylcysteine synthetase/decarboxylase